MFSFRCHCTQFHVSQGGKRGWGDDTTPFKVVPEAEPNVGGFWIKTIPEVSEGTSLLVSFFHTLPHMFFWRSLGSFWHTDGSISDSFGLPSRRDEAKGGRKKGGRHPPEARPHK